MLQPPTANVKTRCHKTPLPSHNSHLGTTATFLCLQAGCRKKVWLYYLCFWIYIGVVHIIFFTVLSQVDQPTVQTAIQIL